MGVYECKYNHFLMWLCTLDTILEFMPYLQWQYPGFHLLQTTWHTNKNTRLRWMTVIFHSVEWAFRLCLAFSLMKSVHESHSWNIAILLIYSMRNDFSVYKFNIRLYHDICDTRQLVDMTHCKLSNNK